MKSCFKQLLIIITALLILMITECVLAEEVVSTSGTFGKLDWILDEEGVLTISGNAEMRYPSSSQAWRPYSSLIKTVIISEGVTSISDNAFSDCSNLLNISIPNSVTSIGYSAFNYCSGLTNISIPDGVTSIEYGTFMNCKNLTNASMPDSIMSIGENAFASCSSLTSISIPDNVTSIGRAAFLGCSNLTSISIPDNVTSISSSAFSSCSNLTSIDIPDNVTSIESSAFYNCSSLTSISIPDNVTSIESSAFEGCSSLTSISIPDGITRIKGRTFYGCNSLSSIYIPDSVTDIEGYAFCGCHCLESIHIPDSVASVGNYAFSSCRSLTSISIPNGVTSLGDGVFSGCSSLTSISIPDGITSLEGTFSGCSNLTSIYIPEDVTSIGEFAFSNCSSLSSIHIPDSVTNIGNRAFYNCSSLASVSIPNNVTSIGELAFHKCTSLTSISIPENVAYVGNSAFYYCDQLKKVWIASMLDLLGDRIVFSSYRGYYPTIYCYEYSPTESWTKEKKVPHVLIDNIILDDVTEISITYQPTYELGSSHRLDCYDIWPKPARPVSFSSSNQDVAIVSNDGILTPVAPGTVDITITANSVSKAFTVTIIKPRIPATSFTLPDVWVVAKQTQQAIVEDVQPADADLNLTWEVGSSTYAQVADNGLVTGGAIGETTITVTDSVSGLTRTATVYSRRPVTAIAFAEDTVAVYDEQVQLTANVTMNTQSCVNHLVSFSSSDESVAVVDRSGIVTRVSTGSATITATAVNDSGITATCKVICYPANMLNIPAGTITIESEAFTDLQSAEAIRLPASVETIAPDAFDKGIILFIPTGCQWVRWAHDNGYSVIEE